MFEREKYGRILVPMVTPFGDDGEVDYDAAVTIAEMLIETDRADSIILSGTTGEFHTMQPEERVKLFEVIMQAVGDRIPLIAGIGATSTREVVGLGRAAARMGFRLAMVVSPYYTKPDQQELYRHFRTVAESLDIDLMLYNIPIFAGVNLDFDLVTRLSAIENIVGIKEEAELNPKQITDYVNSTPAEFTVYCGDDAMILESYAGGGPARVGGAVSGASHLIGDRIREMIDLFVAGKVLEAAETQQRFLPLFRALSPGERTNPVSLLKEGMRLLGYPAGLPRPPLTPGREAEVAQLRRVMKRLAIL